jgi:hypothetical protein
MLMRQSGGAPRPADAGTLGAAPTDMAVLDAASVDSAPLEAAPTDTAAEAISRVSPAPFCHFVTR